MIIFLHSLYNGILRARGEHTLLFAFFELCFAPCILCFEKQADLENFAPNLCV